MKLLGLTGGLGMGKSACARLLLERGVPVVDTDDLARRIVEPGEPALDEIRRAFGDAFIGPEGKLLRSELARRIFADPTARRQLEGILHPRIRQLWREQAETWRRENRPLGMVVIPLLFETGAEKELDGTVCVACSSKTQRQRLLARNWPEKEIEQRLAAQLPAEKKIALADYVIWSEGSLQLHAQQLDRILSGLGIIHTDPAVRDG